MTDPTTPGRLGTPPDHKGGVGPAPDGHIPGGAPGGPVPGGMPGRDPVIRASSISRKNAIILLVVIAALAAIPVVILLAS